MALDKVTYVDDVTVIYAQNMNDIQDAIIGLESVTEAEVITDTASGSVASFSDGADDVPVKSLKMNIEPVQSGSGDPSPSNIRPITGRTGGSVYRVGKNFVENNMTSFSNSSFTVVCNDDGSLTATATLTSTRVCCYNLATNLVSGGTGQNDRKKHIPNGTYKYSVGNNNSGCRLQIIASNAEDESTVETLCNANNGTVTIDDTYKYNWVRIAFTAGTYTNINIYPMIRLASDTDDTYEPYQGTTIPVSWQTEVGTVYGGTLDVATGTLTVDMASVDLGTLTWEAGTTNPIFKATVSGGKIPSPTSAQGNGIGYCSAYKIVKKTYANMVNGEMLVGSYINGGGNYGIVIKNTNYSDATEFKTSVTGQTLVYPLATPLEYTLTPVEVRTLLGQNHIWTDVGSVSVDYRADTKLYIDKKIAEIINS